MTLWVYNLKGQTFFIAYINEALMATKYSSSYMQITYLLVMLMKNLRVIKLIFSRAFRMIDLGQVEQYLGIEPC